MIESIINAKKELLRVDHLIYVTLKYTRTVDVLKNTIGRMITFYEFFVEALAKKAVADKKMEDIPTAPKILCEELSEIYKDDEIIQESLKFFMFLRTINRATYDKEQEYRRHVTMIVQIEGQEHRVNIDIITDYYKKAKEVIDYIEKTYYSEEE